jgi:hypothetical protein
MLTGKIQVIIVKISACGIQQTRFGETLQLPAA